MSPIKESTLCGDWHYEYIKPSLVQAKKIKETILSEMTDYQSVVIHETSCFGKSLVLDNKTQSTEIDEFIYHETLVHPCLVSHQSPTEIFVAGGAEGATIREVLSHNIVKKVTMVDLDEKLVNLCKKYLPNLHCGSFDDSRLELHHIDALQFLKKTNLRFDVMIMDIPDPIKDGPAFQLFTREFYNLVRSRLKPNGAVVTQAGPTGLTLFGQYFSPVFNTIASVFPKSFAYETFVPSFGSTWGFVVGSIGLTPNTLSVKTIDSLVSQRVNRYLRHYDGTTHKSIFSLPKYLRAGITKEKRVITNAKPIYVE